MAHVTVLPAPLGSGGSLEEEEDMLSLWPRTHDWRLAISWVAAKELNSNYQHRDIQ